MSLADAEPPTDDILFKPYFIEIDPIVYDPPIPVLTSSSAAPSNSTYCLPPDTDKFSFTAIEIP